MSEVRPGRIKATVMIPYKYNDKETVEDSFREKSGGLKKGEHPVVSTSEGRR